MMLCSVDDANQHRIVYEHQQCYAIDDVKEHILVEIIIVVANVSELGVQVKVMQTNQHRYINVGNRGKFLAACLANSDHT